MSAVGSSPLIYSRRDDQNRNVLKRIATYHSASGEMQYTYLDNNGDGLWDVFLDETRGMYYVRSNLFWILSNQK